MMETKKGGILDVFFLTFFVFAIMISIIVMFLVYGTINAAMIGQGLDTWFLESALDAILLFDGLMVFVYIGSGIAAVVSAFAIRTHPIFFFLFLLVQILLLSVTPILQGAFTDITTTDSVSVAAAEFPIFSLIMEFMPIIALVLSVVVALVMFALPG